MTRINPELIKPMQKAYKRVYSLTSKSCPRISLWPFIRVYFIMAKRLDFKEKLVIKFNRIIYEIF